MTNAPEAYVNWINQHVGFSPRGQAHSDLLTACIVRDMRAQCLLFGEHLSDGRLELRTNVGITGRRHGGVAVGHEAAEDDPEEIAPNLDGVVLRAGSPGASETQAPLTFKHKVILTAQGNSRTRRFLTDARLYADDVHFAGSATIAAYAVVINTSLSYRSRRAFTRPSKAAGAKRRTDAETAIQLFQRMKLREEPTEPAGRCDAVLVMAIDYDGVNPGARLVQVAPAPDAASPFGYERFLERLCRLYESRSAC